MFHDCPRMLGVPIGGRVEDPFTNFPEAVKLGGAEVAFEAFQGITCLRERLGCDCPKASSEVAEEEFTLAPLALELSDSSTAFVCKRDI